MFDIGEHEGARFLTMEFVEGQMLSACIDVGPKGVGRPLASDLVLPVSQQLCAGLSAAHAVGVIHRDLKPDNVMLGNDGRVAITDFGIARAWQPSKSPTQATNEFVGTPEYMSPEQAAGGSIDLRTDIYSLGVMLFELLTGTVPFTGATPLITAAARLIKSAPDPRSRRPDLPAAVAQVVLRCMSRQPADRYDNAEQVAAAFTEALQTSGGLLTGAQPSVSKPHSASVQIPLWTLQPDGQAAEGRFRTPAHTTTVDAPITGKTIAVLPFRNQGPPEDSYLADGISDDLIDALSVVKDLRVCSRAAVALHKNQPDPLAHGRALDVEVLVEGTVRRLGDKLRITARLVRVHDGVQVWAQRFDRPAADALQVSDEVAQAVAAALTGETAPPPRTVLHDAQAVDLYLRARALLQHADLASLRESAVLLEQVLAVRPNDPKMLTAYAQVRARLWFFGGEGAGEAARAAAEHAVAAAPNLGDSHLALATIRFHAADPAGAVQELKYALKLAPNLAAAHDLMGRILVETGPPELGQRYIDHAIALEPWMAKTQYDRVRVQALLGHWDAVDQLLAELWRASAPSLPMWVLRARLTAWRGDKERSEACLRSPELALEQFSLPRQILQTALGRLRPDLSKLIGEVGSQRSSPRARCFIHQLEVEMFSLQADTDASLRSLARAVDGGLFDRLWVDGCPLLAPLRVDPRFPALRKIVIARTIAVREALR